MQAKNWQLTFSRHHANARKDDKMSEKVVRFRRKKYCSRRLKQ